MTPHRPAIESLLMQMAKCEDNHNHTFNVGELREAFSWALHLEKMMTPSHRNIVYEHNNYGLVYELSNAGHIIWVTWHRKMTDGSFERVRHTIVAAVRTRLGWEFAFNAAPLELTTLAVNYFADANYKETHIKMNANDRQAN